MKIYFLFGNDAVRHYESGELNRIKHDDYYVFAYDLETSTPQELLSLYDGWDGYCEINKKDFKYLATKLNK